MPIPSLPLNDGSTIPQLGLGFWQITPDQRAEDVARQGIAAGYRLLDTAQLYGNEAGVGSAVAGSGLPRDAFTVTTKLRNGAHARDEALRAFDASLQRLRLERVDLFLIHWPRPAQGRYAEAWRTLVELRDQGRARSIGVSNFGREELRRIIDDTGVVPAVNQVELHPRFQQRPLRALHDSLGIVTQSWSPLGSGRLLGDPAIAAIAKRHDRSAAQVIIRWHLQQGLVAIPKSATPARIAENIDVSGFILDAEDMAALAALDSPEGRNGPDPATAEFSF